MEILSNLLPRVYKNVSEKWLESIDIRRPIRCVIWGYIIIHPIAKSQTNNVGEFHGKCFGLNVWHLYQLGILFDEFLKFLF